MRGRPPGTTASTSSDTIGATDGTRRSRPSALLVLSASAGLLCTIRACGRSKLQEVRVTESQETSLVQMGQQRQARLQLRARLIPNRPTLTPLIQSHPTPSPHILSRRTLNHRIQTRLNQHHQHHQAQNRQPNRPANRNRLPLHPARRRANRRGVRRPRTPTGPTTKTAYTTWNRTATFR